MTGEMFRRLEWFLDLNPDEETFDASSLSKNQERLLQHRVNDLFFAADSRPLTEIRV